MTASTPPAGVDDRCLPDHVLERYFGGSGTESERADIARHVGGCERCRARLAAFGRAGDTQTNHDRPAPYVPRGTGPEPGTVLRGRYEITARIGRGGMGDVFRARDLVLKTDIALKTLRGPLLHDEVYLARFRNEVRVARLVTHPNICRLHDFVEDQDLVFLTMEYIEGTPLSALLRETPRMQTDAIRRVLIAVAEGVGAAHAAGVIHRDLKPQNIMVQPSGRVVVVDFGIARGEDDASLTREGSFIGTPRYMAPEQLMGGASSPRSDVYALGLIAHEMITGEVPLLGDTPLATAQLRATTDPPPLRGATSSELAAVVTACLQRAPQQRPPDANALVPLLKRGAGPTPTPQARRRRLAILAGAVVIGVTAAAAWFAYPHLAPRPAIPLDTTLRVAMPGTRTRLDVFSSIYSSATEALALVHETLTIAEADGRVVPRALGRLEVRDQGKTLVLHARQGATFHPHPCLPTARRPVSGRDLVFSLELAAKHGRLPLAVEGLDAFQRGESPHIAGVTVEGDDRAVIRLVTPSPLAAAALQFTELLPFELAGCEDVRDLRQPVGTGPFRFDGPPEGDLLRLVRNETAGPADPGRASAIEFVHARTPLEAITLAGSGAASLAVVMPEEATVALDDVYAPAPKLRREYAAWDLEVANAPAGHEVRLLALIVQHGKRGVLDDVRVRRAVALALDPAPILATLRERLEPFRRFLFPEHLGHTPSAHEPSFDPRAARAMLSLLGPLAPVRLGVRRPLVPAAQVVLRQLEAVGLKGQVMPLDPDGAERAVRAGDIDIFLSFATSWTTGSEPFPYVPAYAVPGLVRGFTSPRLAPLLAPLMQSERSARVALYEQMEAIMLQELPIIPIARPPPDAPDRVWFVRRGIEGLVDPGAHRTLGRLPQVLPAARFASTR